MTMAETKVVQMGAKMVASMALTKVATMDYTLVEMKVD